MELRELFKGNSRALVEPGSEVERSFLAAGYGPKGSPKKAPKKAKPKE